MEETTREMFSPPNLPLEMVEEILLRLPVKSLTRFKCVCSSWRSLISETLFALKHASILEKSKALTTCKKSPYGVITTSRHHLKSCCVHSLYNESTVLNVQEHDGELLGRDYYQVVGTCHGLICFHVYYNQGMYLWNPTIKVQQRLSSSDLETTDDEFVVTYGFGYDESKDDYKVVALLQQRHQVKTEANIYSTRQKFWRRSINSCLPSGLVVADRSRSGIYINGTLNWPATQSPSSWSIISYDMSHDVFKEFPGPVCCSRGCFTMTLGDLRGCLSMVCYCKGANADVWVMKEFGKGESWVKLLSIPGLTDFVRPLWISNDLVVLLEFRSGLAFYNSFNGGFHYPVSKSLSGCRDAKVYVKTMVSPSDI